MSGAHGCTLTLNPCTEARPDVASGATSVDRQLGHTGAGGWNHVRHCRQRWIHKKPSPPPSQKAAVSSVTSGRGWKVIGSLARRLACSLCVLHAAKLV